MRQTNWKDKEMDATIHHTQKLCLALRAHLHTVNLYWDSRNLQRLLYYISYGSGTAELTIAQAQALFKFKGISHDTFAALCKNGVDPDLAFVLSLEV